MANGATTQVCQREGLLPKGRQKGAQVEEKGAHDGGGMA